MKIPWEEASNSQDYALTTGPKWSGSKHLKGSIEFASCFDGQYYDEFGAEFDMADDAWIVLAEKPGKEGGAA